MKRTCRRPICATRQELSVSRPAGSGFRAEAEGSIFRGAALTQSDCTLASAGRRSSGSLTADSMEAYQLATVS